jgi:hypothetical protein
MGMDEFDGFFSRLCIYGGEGGDEAPSCLLSPLAQPSPDMLEVNYFITVQGTGIILSSPNGIGPMQPPRMFKLGSMLLLARLVWWSERGYLL